MDKRAQNVDTVHTHTHTHTHIYIYIELLNNKTIE